MGKRKQKCKANHKQNPTSSKACGLPRGDYVVKKQGPSRFKVSHKVTAALLWLAPFICSGLVMVTMFYSLLDPVPLCMVTKIARDAVKALLAYTTSPQATSCALGVAAVFAASIESVRDMKLAGDVNAVRQAVTMLLKLVVYLALSFFVTSVFLRVVNSVAFWHVLASLPEAIGVNIDIAKILTGVLACIGLLCLLKDRFETAEPHHFTKLVQKFVCDAAKGVVVLLNVGLYTTVPLLVAIFSLTLADYIYVLGSQAGIGDAVGPRVADVGMGLLLAATLTIVGISALLIEGYYLLKAKPTDAPIINAEDSAPGVGTTDTSKPADNHGAALETQSQKPSGMLQSHKRQSTKIAANTDSGLNDNKQADTIMAAHGPQRVANGQSDTTQGQTAASAVTSEQTAGAQAHNTTPNKKSRKIKKRETTTRSNDSHARASGSDDRKTAIVTATQTEVLDRASTQTHSAATRVTVSTDDAFSSLVKTLLKRTVGEPPAVQYNIMQSMNRLYQAVPSWLLTFGAAHNPGCSAFVGLETFKLCFNSNHPTKNGDSSLPDDSVKSKSMVLLLRTFVAAITEEELGQPNSQDRLLAKDVMRLAPQAGMPKYLRDVPQWQLTALRQRLSL